MCINCTYSTEGKPVFPEIFRHQQPPKYSVFMCIDCAYYTKGRTIFSEIFRHQQLPKYSVFMSIDSVYYTEGRTIFSEIFRHQLPPKYFIFTHIQCTYSPSQNLEYLGAENCRNISFSRVLSSHIIPKANQYSPKYFGTNSC